MSYKELIDSRGKEIDFKVLDKFLNTAMTSTLQEEYYSKKDEQTKKVLKIHDELLNSNREVYSISLLLPINNIQQSLIIKNLIKQHDVPEKVKDWENNIILDILKRMPTNRAYKTFEILAKSKINNARAKWVARQYLREKGNSILFEAVKYKRQLKSMVKHFHVQLDKICKIRGIKDMERFLFDKELKKIKNELYVNYMKAKKDKDAVFELPYSIAEGFKNLHKISDEEFMRKMKKQLTHAEKRRVQARAERAGVEVELDLSRESPVNIQKFLRSEKVKQKDLDKGLEAFEKSCEAKAKKLYEYFDFKNIKVIVDNSGSMAGSEEKKNHPIAVAEALANVLKYLSKETEIYAFPNESKFLVKPCGESNVAEALMTVMKELNLDEENLIVIISDGYENAPAGLVNQILVAFKKKLDKKEKTLIIHINPVFAPEAEDVKKLSELIHTFGARDVRQLFLILLLAVIRNKKDKKIRKVLEQMKQKVKVREKKKKKVKK